MVQTMLILQGERVLLRPLRESDIEESVRVWTPELRYWYGGSRISGHGPTTNGRRKLLERVRRGEEGHFFALETEGRYIGFTALRVSDEERSGSLRIGIENPEYWGRGYGTEAIGLLLGYAFQGLDLHRVSLRVAAYNHRARRCYTKCGFRVEGIERESFQVDGAWQDDVLMAILKREWEARQTAPTSEGEVTIRPYRSADFPALTALLEAAGFGHFGPSDTEASIAATLATQQSFLLLAEADGRLVGTARGTLERGWGWVQRVAVHPEYRRRGIAKRLIGEVNRTHAALGAYRTVLLTHRDNEAAQALYRGLGYDLWDDVIVMGTRLATEEPVREERCCES